MHTLRPKEQRTRTLRACALIFSALFIYVPGAGQQPQPQPTPTPAPADNEFQVGALVWTQTSGEWRALSYQTFLLARMMLDQDLKTNKNKKQKRAVVVDVDETVLDNSPHQAWLVKNRQTFNQQNWGAWTSLAEAQPLPGAVGFLRYADSKGVRVFYITNRKETTRAATEANLKKVGFPNVSGESVLLRAEVPSKEPRRKKVAEQYRIVLLLGDNLNDFAEVFEKRTVAERLMAVEQNRDQFGTHYIVLPNALYGDWENALYLNMQSGETRDTRRKAALKAFTPQP